MVLLVFVTFSTTNSISVKKKAEEVLLVFFLGGQKGIDFMFSACRKRGSLAAMSFSYSFPVHPSSINHVPVFLVVSTGRRSKVKDVLPLF